jgi:hypothetical protein
MGTINTTTACGPDGQTIVTIDVSNGYLTVYIDGIEGHELVTGPGTHTVEWWGYPTSNGVPVAGPDVLWDTKLVTVDALTNCEAAPTTTTAAPTTSEAPTESTALVPPSTIATITPQIDMDVDPCVTSTGCTTTTAVTGRLPETATSSTVPASLTAAALLAVGTTLVLIKRRVTS